MKQNHHKRNRTRSLWGLAAAVAAGVSALFTNALDAAGAAPYPGVCERACWNARWAPLSPNMSGLNRVIIHHTAQTLDYYINTLADSKARVRSIQNYHMDVNGWSDIGYHYLVDKFGNKFEGHRNSNVKSEQRRGAHDNTNFNSFGFNVMGFYHPPHNQFFTAAARNALWDLIAWRMPNGWTPYGSGWYAGRTVGYVAGHRDVYPTACPGDGVWSTIGTNFWGGEARNAIDARIQGTAGSFNPIENLGGYYRLKAKHSGKYFDMGPDHVSNGAPLQQFDWWGGANQIFHLTHLGDGYYRIRAKSAPENRVLDVGGCATANGSPVHQWDWFDNDCQKFRIEDVGDGFVRLVAKNSGRVLEVGGGSQGNSAGINIWDWNGADHQRFQIEWVSIPVPDLSGAYKVSSAHNGKVMEIGPDHISNGAGVQIFDWWGGSNQTLNFDHLGGGWYKIWAASAGSSRVLDVTNCNFSLGAPIQQWDWADNDCQKFLIEEVGPGQVRIKSSGGMVLDHALPGGNGTGVYLWSWWGGANQRWILEPTAALPPPDVVTVDNADAGFSASANWGSATWASDKFGADYQARATEAVGDAAVWTADLPSAGTYTVYAWWTAAPNRATAATYIVDHANGSTPVVVNQTQNGGQWNSLGAFQMDAGPNQVRLSCWTSSGDVVIADAVRFIKL